MDFGTEFSNPFTIAKSDNDEIALNLIKEHANILSKIEEYKELDKIESDRRSEERNKMLNNPKCITREQYEAQKKQNAK